MKKIYLIATVVGVVLFSHCTPKISSEISKKSDLQMIESVEVKEIKRTAEEFEQGKLLMTQGCKGCHILFDPIDFTVEEWGPILDDMIPKARLTSADADLVRDYIIAHSKDYNK